MALTLSLPARFNIADALLLPRLEAGAGEQPYLRCCDAELTVAGAYAASSRAAHALAGLGLRPGDRVALLLREGFAFPACFWGAIRAGLLPVPLNPALTAADYRHYLADSGAAALVVEADLWPRIEPLRPQLPALRSIVTLGAQEAASGAALPDLDTLLAAAPEHFASRQAAPDAPAFLLYTSGSTGAPKAAVHRHRDAIAVVETYLRRVLRLQPGELTYSAPKLFFAYGLGNSLLFPLAAGCTAVIDPAPASASGCFALLARHRPSVFYAVPTLFNAMLRLDEAWQAGREHPPPARPDLAHLRVCVSGGEALPAGVFSRWRARFGLEVLDGIGSTEALHFYVANAPGRARAGSTGRPVPGYDVRLVDETGAEPPPGAPGELWLRGDSVTPGYWNQPERTRAALREGWLRTGDWFRRAADGDYRYEGRKDDLFKVGGSWLNPDEVEQALLSHPAVAECAVVGRGDATGFMQSHAHVVLRAGFAAGAALASALRDHVGERLAAFKVPQAVAFHATLPRTATGKLQRFRLGEAEDTMAASPPAAASGAATSGWAAWHRPEERLP